MGEPQEGPNPSAEPSPDRTTDAEILGESRWPMAGTVLAAMILTILLPPELLLIPAWVLVSVEGVLLVALVLGDPGAISKRTTALRAASIVLVSVLVLSSLGTTVKLIDSLVTGSSATDSAGELLEAGAVVWLLNIIAFGILYWEIDGGGAAARAHHLPEFPDFGFPQQMNPDLAPRSWRPRFIDYLYLGFTNATAFSPTDAMPLAPWAKITMAIQSAISLALLGLVVARAVNVFS